MGLNQSQFCIWVKLSSSLCKGSRIVCICITSGWDWYTLNTWSWFSLSWTLVVSCFLSAVLKGSNRRLLSWSCCSIQYSRWRILSPFGEINRVDMYVYITRKVIPIFNSIVHWCGHSALSYQFYGRREMLALYIRVNNLPWYKILSVSALLDNFPRLVESCLLVHARKGSSIVEGCSPLRTRPGSLVFRKTDKDKADCLHQCPIELKIGIPLRVIYTYISTLLISPKGERIRLLEYWIEQHDHDSSLRFDPFRTAERKQLTTRVTRQWKPRPSIKCISIPTRCDTDTYYSGSLTQRAW